MSNYYNSFTQKQVADIIRLEHNRTYLFRLLFYDPMSHQNFSSIIKQCPLPRKQEQWGKERRRLPILILIRTNWCCHLIHFIRRIWYLNYVNYFILWDGLRVLGEWWCAVVCFLHTTQTHDRVRLWRYQKLTDCLWCRGGISIRNGYGTCLAWDLL